MPSPGTVGVVLHGGVTLPHHAGSGEYLRLRQAPGDGGFTLRLTQPGGTALPTSVVGRLNVIRVR